MARTRTPTEQTPASQSADEPAAALLAVPPVEILVLGDVNVDSVVFSMPRAADPQASATATWQTDSLYRRFRRPEGANEGSGSIYIQFKTDGKTAIGSDTHWLQLKSRWAIKTGETKADPNYRPSARYRGETDTTVSTLLIPQSSGPYVDTQRPNIHYDVSNKDGQNGGTNFRAKDELSIVDKPSFDKMLEGYSAQWAQYDTYLVDEKAKAVYYHVRWTVSITKGADGWGTPVYNVVSGEPVSKLPIGAGTDLVVGYKGEYKGGQYVGLGDPVKLPNPYPVEDK